jgi:hypothetical protein
MKFFILAAASAFVLGVGVANAADPPAIKEGYERSCINGVCNERHYRRVDGQMVLNASDSFPARDRSNFKEVYGLECGNGLCTERRVVTRDGVTLLNDIDQFRQDRGHSGYDGQNRRYGQGYGRGDERRNYRGYGQQYGSDYDRPSYRQERRSPYSGYDERSYGPYRDPLYDTNNKP